MQPQIRRRQNRNQPDKQTDQRWSTEESTRPSSRDGVRDIVGLQTEKNNHGQRPVGDKNRRMVSQDNREKNRGAPDGESWQDTDNLWSKSYRSEDLDRPTDQNPKLMKHWTQRACIVNKERDKEPVWIGHGTCRHETYTKKRLNGMDILLE